MNENPELLEYSIKQGIDYAVNFQRAFMPTIRTLTKDWLSNKYIGILSLSEEKNNNLMWSHYTGNHEGFVLEFDSSNNFFHQPINNDIGELRKVIYESEKPVFNSMKNVNSDFVFYIKWKEWQYENEWRLILPLINAEKPILINAKEIYLFKIPPECITGIIIGSRSPFNLKEDIKKLIKTDNRYYHLSYYEAKYHDKGYDLLIEKIDL